MAKQIHRDDWLKIGETLYGEDPRKWEFKCPACGNVQSHESVTARNPGVGSTSGWIYFACEGRHTKNVGCDWTLGGFFSIQVLDVYYEGSFMHCMAFADASAKALVDEAATRFTPPQHVPFTARTWAEYEWPEWVPAELREQVQEFWGCKNSRGPQGWYQSAVQNNAPPLGTTARLRGTGSEEEEKGRFVPAWNNIGRIVREDGTVACVSF